MKRFYFICGEILIGLGVLFLLAFSMILKKGPNDPLPQDMLGFSIPQAPTWTSYIPFVGFFIGILFEHISIHGLVSIGVTISLILLGSALIQNNK